MGCFPASDGIHFPQGWNFNGAPALGRTFAGVALVLAIAIIVRIQQPTGWLGSDDAAYYSAAEHVLTDTPITRAHHHYTRTAIILPVAASVAIFGHHTWAVALPSFLASLGCVILVVLLGRQLLGWWEGLLAGLVVAVLPYFRVLSTTAYPDAHVCLWTTTSVSICLLSLRTGARWLLVCSGVALGLAISSKVFAATTSVALGVLILQTHKRNVRQILICATLIFSGWLMFFLAEGYFFYRWTGDFFFALNAHQKSQLGVPGMAPESAASVVGLAALIHERMSLMLQTTSSGWGLIGLAFWPAVIAGLFFARSRALSLWALATYLLIAFFPVRLQGGYQPYPHFHGRHILSACVPFSLCLASLASMAITHLEHFRKRHAPNMKTDGESRFSFAPWAFVGLGIIAATQWNPRELGGFRDRPTGRVGEAIRVLATQDIWPPDKPIFLTPSTYWRYRIFFPPHLHARLRIAVSDGAPDWWRHVAPGIELRSNPLPLPGNAILVGTPTQLNGKPESWDYGVAFPETILRWKSEPGIAVGAGQQILALSGNGLPATEALVVAVGVIRSPDPFLADSNDRKPTSNAFPHGL